MTPDAKRALPSSQETASCAEHLARGASIEVNSLEVGEFHAARELLRPGQRIFVSHLPGQTWKQSLELCAMVTAAGLDPVPHIPVRLLADEAELDGVLAAASDAGVREPLLLAGDYPRVTGAFADVSQVLRTGRLEHRGFKQVSFAGHPEGHPAVPAKIMHQAQVDKWRLATQQGLEASFVTQFFFAAKPFSHWAFALRSEGVQGRLIAGLAGPAGIARLLRLARRCGVGPSIRNLSARPAAMLGLLTDHDPDALLRDLAAEWHGYTGLFDGIHLFSFGGFVRTAKWLRRYAS